LNLKIEDRGSNYFFMLSWFPFWPGKVDVEASGTIVKQKE